MKNATFTRIHPKWEIVRMLRTDSSGLLAVVHIAIRNKVIVDEHGEPSEFHIIRTPEGINKFITKITRIVEMY